MSGGGRYHPNALGIKPTASSPCVTAGGGRLTITSVLLEGEDGTTPVADLPRTKRGRPTVWCPFCGREGIYKQQQTAINYTEHFAHAHTKDDHCTPADLDNVLHRRAIAMLLYWLEVRRHAERDAHGEVYCRRCGQIHPRTILPPDSWATEAPEIRVTTPEGYRVPDVVVRRGDELVGVFEVAHTCLVDDARRRDLIRLGIPGLELNAGDIVERLADTDAPLPFPRQHWNLELADRDLWICSECRTVPASIDAVVNLIQASLRHRPQLDALGTLSKYLELSCRDGLEPNHLRFAVERPERLRELDPDAAAALADRQDLAGPDLKPLAKKVLGWADWNIWAGVPLEEILRDPHTAINRRIAWVLQEGASLGRIHAQFERSLRLADQLALWTSCTESLNRVHCHARLALAHAAADGHTAMELDNLRSALARGLRNLHSDAITSNLRKLVETKHLHALKISTDRVWVALDRFGDAEKQAAEAICHRLNVRWSARPTGAGPRESSPLTQEQRDAIRLAAENSIAMITGGAGTGKSTLIREIVTQSPTQTWLVLAPTWKALTALTQVLRDLGPRVEPLTVARFIMQTAGLLPDGTPGDSVQREAYGSKYSVVVDEIGFLDSCSFKLLVHGARNTRQLVLVGDPNQLPSISPGAVLRDLVASGRIPHMHLRQVHRSNDDSGIPDFATGILDGRFHARGRGIHFLEATSHNQIVEVVAQQYMRMVQNASVLDLQIIAPLNSICDKLNEALQEQCNKQGQLVHPRLRVGDPVIVTDSFEGRLVRGETGKLCAVTAQGDLVLEFDNGRRERVSERAAPMLETAYCITIHKAQGSQWRHVIVGLPSSRHLDRSMLYTAVTRARESVSIVGPRSGLSRAAQHTAAANRQTLLEHHLRKMTPRVPAAAGRTSLE